MALSRERQCAGHTKGDIAGVAITRLGVQIYKDAIKRREDRRHWYWLSGVVVENGEIDDTDTCAVRRNLISITPLRVDLTDVRGIDALSRCSFRWPTCEA